MITAFKMSSKKFLKIAQYVVRFFSLEEILNFTSQMVWKLTMQYSRDGYGFVALKDRPLFVSNPFQPKRKKSLCNWLFLQRLKTIFLPTAHIMILVHCDVHNFNSDRKFLRKKNEKKVVFHRICRFHLSTS